NKNLDTERQALDIDRELEYARLAQERELEVKRAEQRAEVAREKATREQEAERAQIQARETVERARIAAERAVEEDRIDREKTIQELEITRRQAIELAEQQRAIAVAEQSKAQSEAQAAADIARARAVSEEERVFTAREAEMAQRKKLIDISNAEAEAETSRIRSLAAKIRHEVEAEGLTLMNKAANLLTPEARQSALRTRLLDKLEGIIRESVKPMERIEGIRILHVDGLGGHSAPANGNGNANIADSVVNSALRFRAQAPLVDQLLREIGVQGGDIGQAANALLEGGKKE
ncbi:MAG TPA: flotillin domain-containing protein, partial [Burkholderiales bacterium]|nr:flotillin domain-containing protein [Burkholderiales bacterium]